MKLFAQIRKVDEAKRLVYGRAAEEVVDKADEIMDYASSKPYFEKWSQDIAKDTDGKSLGNVRAMHGKIAAGKLTGIDFNDAEKAIDICAKVVDDAEWKKVCEGVYTGFSVGGAYVDGSKKVEKLDDKSVTRYTASPSEISLVDRPCIPTAKFFEVQKADGTLAKVDFKEPVAEEVDGGTINGTPEEVDQLIKVMTDGGLKLSDVIAKIAAVPAQAPAAEIKVPAAIEKLDAGALRKNFYNCADLASLLNTLVNLRSNAVWTAYYDGAAESSTIPKRLAAVIALAGQVLKEMIDEELKELGEGASLELSEKAGGLAKFDEADPLFELIKIGARNSKADADRLAKIHDLAVELGHTCAAEKVEKVEATLGAEGLQKMVAEAVAPLQKALDEAKTQITKLEAQPAPARITLRAISKTEDAVEEVKQTIPPAEVKDDHGEIHKAASLIKTLHQSGGVPLRAPLSK